MAEKKDHYYYGLGRRKEAIATARVANGTAGVLVNEQPLDDYFGSPALASLVMQPLSVADLDKKMQATIKVKGGGKRGQADAAKLAIARALNEMSTDLRPTLKKAGLLTRDPREKERKKPGLKRARKASQWKKR
jgi:small subunit ribosomal protein S9